MKICFASFWNYSIHWNTHNTGIPLSTALLEATSRVQCVAQLENVLKDQKSLFQHVSTALKFQFALLSPHPATGAIRISMNCFKQQFHHCPDRGHHIVIKISPACQNKATLPNTCFWGSYLHRSPALAEMQKLHLGIRLERVGFDTSL